MASLTPGVLTKLLENAGNRVTGEHRQALLQVTEIVPRLSDEPWQSRGYFLKLSDSLHAAYVSLSDDDSELICADKLRLGQFVYVTRLDSASPVPLVRGLNPIPKRSPCVGNPVDLVSSDSLHLTTTPFSSNKKKSSNSHFSKSKEIRRLSLDSSRRVWDHSPVKKTSSPSSTSSASALKLKKSTSVSPNVKERKVSVKSDSPLKSPTPSVSPLKNKNDNLCPKLPSTPPRKSTSRSPFSGAVTNQLVKVPLNFKTWDDASSSWDDLPPQLCNLGMQVVTRRNIAFTAAARSLEEAAASDAVIQCMCMFAELCESRRTHSAGLLVQRFLELHQSLQKTKMIFDTFLAETKPNGHNTLQCLVEDECKVPSRKNAISWVQAAVGTNLSKFNLFRTQAKGEILNGEKCHSIVIENSCEEIKSEDSSAQNNQSRVAQPNLLPNSSTKKLPLSKRTLLVSKNKDTNKPNQSKESEIKVAATLAEKLLAASREWFLKYLEESLSKKFGLKNEGCAEIACLLGQLKKVNHWLDNLVGGDKVDLRVENLRKSLYRFLLEHVNSTVSSS